MRLSNHWAIVAIIHFVQFQFLVAGAEDTIQSLSSDVETTATQRNASNQFGADKDGDSSVEIERELSLDAVGNEVNNKLHNFDSSTTLEAPSNNEIDETDLGSDYEYYFMDIMGFPLDDKIKAKIFYCDDETDDSLECTPEIVDATLRAPDTAASLGGSFTLEYPTDSSVCRGCKSITEPISVYSSASEVEEKLEALVLVGDVEVTATESMEFNEYKVPVESGIVGANRNFYIRFLQNEFSSTDLDDKQPQPTSFSGDLPMLILDQRTIHGNPTRDSAYSDDYKGSVTEVVKGTDLNHEGFVEVAVSLNGGSDFSTDNPIFEYKAVPIVQSISPSHGSVMGGTSIRVKGDNFDRNAVKSCLFWSTSSIQVVPITQYVSPTEVICTSPASMESHDAHLLLFANDDISIFEGSLQSRGKMFHYHDEIRISSVHPESAQTIGNATVNIFGGPFYSSEGLFCSFGGVNTSALFISPTQITCQSPLHAAGIYSLEVTQNGQDFTQSGRAFRFYHGSRVHSIYPVHGPGSQAGTDVKVNGDGFVNTTTLYCRFGSVVVPATFIHSSEVHCPAPPVKHEDYSWMSLPHQRHIGNSDQLFPASHAYPRYLGKLVSFELTNNGQDFTNSGLMFLFQKDIEIIAVSRSEGPSRGGTPVFISGSNFVNSTKLSCRFGNTMAAAHFLTRESIICFSTAIYGKSYRNSWKEKSYPILVSNNAVDFTYAGEFIYTSSIPRGMYQAGVEGSETMLACPRGSYCHDALEANFTLCSPGTYQPLLSQSRCIACPIGYVCSEFGLSVPRICPRGYVCDERGMSTAKPCPKGFWCDQGTATFDTECFNSNILSSDNIKSDTSFSNMGTCFDNSTDDFGLQASRYPADFWSERHQMPLDVDADVHPSRGKYCLDDSCLKLEDSSDFGVFDKSFDYSSTGFALRRPLVCPSGHYCNAGTATSLASFDDVSSPKPCFNAFHCPEGSSNPKGVGSCKMGFYCRFGIRKACPVGTFCPNDNIFDPVPCEPGSFNFLVGQSECSSCPVGYYCPSYGSKDPVICPPGFVCSRKGLAGPNIRCPAGFYCQNGTQTSDPFRNDTTLRPYACTPGTYCLAGTGYNEVREDTTALAIGGGYTALYAQHCPSGFFCEAASISAKGSGPCPPGFVCPKGTANPRPTPKGSFAEHIGTIEATACLPGFYAPTIQSEKCYECPPGTTCSLEGLWEAEECPPGTYRSSIEADGNGCESCPQGTWSKNWQLREKGECTRCPTGVVCPLEGMTNPCSFSDLPTPYEPIVNFKGTPAFEFEFPHDSMPPRFSMDECLALNFATHEFFYGELIPPYIDVLGRGPHFRSTDQQSLKYQSEAKCYKNSQPDGTLVYMRMAEYYGPQFDIQTGYPHQGYGTAALLNQMIATAPPPGYDFNFRYGYFRGVGHGYVDIPKARTFDPLFNCTKGFKLMNSTLVTEGTRRIVYTDPSNDFEGGYDVEKCTSWDENLDCFVDERFEVHAKDECCNIEPYKQRAIFLANDQFYEGTCEADIICAHGRSAPSQAKACDEGFVCDEATSLETSMNHPCPAGYACSFATTPDTNLQAPNGQLSKLCKEGYYCSGGAGTNEKPNVCPNNYFCPTGTADPYTGLLANDALLRLLPDSSESQTNNLYQGDAFLPNSNHDISCNAGTRTMLQKRYQIQVQEHINVNHLEYQSDRDEFPLVVEETTEYQTQCARDHKSSLIKDAMRRRECNCRSKFFILAAVYRLWKCTSDEPLDNLSFADSSSLHGKRDYWYPHSRIHRDHTNAVEMDPSMELFGISWGSGRMCKFENSDISVGLTVGRLPSSVHGLLPETRGVLEFDSDNAQLPIRFTYTEQRTFSSYSELKANTTSEYSRELEQLHDGNRSNIDPFIFDLYHSLQLIEHHGEKLEQLIEMQPQTLSDYDFRGSVNWCECQDLLKCPNATMADEGATNVDECKSTKEEILSRITLLPIPVNSTVTSSTAEGSVDNSSPLHLNPYQVAVLTIDQSELPTNFTYGEHYQISIYDGCKPCPLRYQCDKAPTEESTSCKYPSLDRQVELLNQCLKENRKSVCLLPDGSHDDVENCLAASANSNEDQLLFSEPDLELCLSRPYICSDTVWNFRTFRRLCQDTLSNGKKSTIYDCGDVHKWQVYEQWRNGICCDSQAPELRGIDACQDNVCVEDPLLHDLIREKMMTVFEVEYGFIVPMEKPLGQLLLNASLQEEKDHDTPLDLFNEWQSPFVETTHTSGGRVHNKYAPDRSEPWISTSGCCKCQRHTMPHALKMNTVMSGFPDDKHQPIQLTISALAEVDLTVVVELLHGLYYSDFIDYFGSVSKSALRVHTPARFVEEHASRSTVLSLIEKSALDKWNLELPLNLPLSLRTDENKGVEARFLVDRSSNISIGDLQYANSYYNGSKIEELDDHEQSHLLPPDPIDSVRVAKDWLTHDFWALPYIPYFSNCDGYGSHISWSRLLEEHPDCLAVDFENTLPIEEFSFKNTLELNNDACHGVTLQCLYEEEVWEAREKLRWYEATAGSILFYMTRDAVSIGQFVPSSSSEEWGRTYLLNQLRNSYDVIPLSVDKEMRGYRHAIPRHILLELKYFQMTKGNKRFVEAHVYFNDFCTTEDAKTGSATILSVMRERGIEPCEVDINGDIKSLGYDLQVSYYPLNWFDLLNRFEFKVPVYFILYTVMGFTICFMGGIVYGTNRLLTKLRHPPRFLGLSLIKLVSGPQIEGSALALIPYLTIMMIIYSCFGPSNTSAFGFNNVHSQWASTGLISDKVAIDNSVGRLGSSLLVLGFWIVYRGLQKLVPFPDESLLVESNKPSQSTINIVSKRAHFITISFAIQVMMLIFFEYSYSDSFRNQIYRFVVLFRIFSSGIDILMSRTINEKLLMAPLMVLIHMTEILITIGARDFVEFAMTFFIKVATMVVLRLFLYPLIKTCGTLWPRWRMLANQALSKKGLTRQQKKDRENMWKQINEDIELRTEGVEPLLDAVSMYSIEKTGTIIVPFMFLMLMYLYPETEIAMKYGINQHELVYYVTFAFYMLPWMSLVDAFLLSSQELIYGWRVYDYFSYQRWRFANREHRWNLLSQVDASVTPSLQSIDVLCFSSQYYFILTMLTLGFGTNMFGITICLRRDYAFLGDPVFPLIVATIVLCCEVLYALCVNISDATIDAIAWDGIWKLKHLQGTMDDVIAAKLAIGEGRQGDLERERQEYLALNRETFRHKFVDKNRPWILSHLVELITPRTLQDPESTGPDGRPLVEYVRDVYSNLMTVGEGVKRTGDRSDISSDDSSDDEFVQRRKWDRTPLDGNKLLIAQIWLQKARKRRIFSKAVSSIIEKRKTDHCLACSRTLSSCSLLNAGLAWDGKFDIYAIDCLIKEFEDKYSPTENDPTLWKSFFRETADFTTICNICLDGIEQQKLHKNVRHVGAVRPTRPGDISSDDESEDDVFFDPVIIVRSTKEGEMMNKWLQACRQRLGGKFPRKGAEKQTERYLDRLKSKKSGIASLLTKEDPNVPKWDKVVLSVSGASMIKRWLQDAKESSRTRFDSRSEEIRQDLNSVLGQLNADDDWFFGVELRLDGGALKIEGDQILREKAAKEALISKQVSALKIELDEQIRVTRQKLQSKRIEIDQTLFQAQNESKFRKAKRAVELNRTLDERPDEEETLREIYSKEMEQEDKSLITFESQLRKEAELYNSVLEREMNSAKQKYGIDSQTMMERSRQEFVSTEQNWRNNVSLWLGKATKKIESKAMHEMEKSNAVPVANAKMARLEQRRRAMGDGDGAYGN